MPNRQYLLPVSSSSSSGGGGGAPSGPAGGTLAGSYPNPTLAATVLMAAGTTTFTPASGSTMTWLCGIPFPGQWIIQGPNDNFSGHGFISFGSDGDISIIASGNGGAPGVNISGNGLGVETTDTLTHNDGGTWGSGGIVWHSGSSFKDASASTGAANAVLTAGTGGSSMVWRAGASAGPFTGAQITALTTTGGLVTTLTGSSDERLKTDIKPFERGLEAIEKLNPKFYKWNEEGQKKTGFSSSDEQIGLIAQNLQEAIPEAVGLEDGKWLTVNDRPVISALINAVKQLSARVAELEAR